MSNQGDLFGSRTARRARQPFNQVIHPEPKGPRVVIESQRKADANREQDCQHSAVAQIGEQQTSEVNEQNKYFGGHYIGHDRADEKSFFPFEDHAAG